MASSTPSRPPPQCYHPSTMQDANATPQPLSTAPQEEAYRKARTSSSWHRHPACNGRPAPQAGSLCHRRTRGTAALGYASSRFVVPPFLWSCTKGPTPRTVLLTSRRARGPSQAVPWLSRGVHYVEAQAAPTPHARTRPFAIAQPAAGTQAHPYGHHRVRASEGAGCPRGLARECRLSDTAWPGSVLLPHA
jgi:hypothetical protein